MRYTSLHYAAGYGHIGVVRMLVLQHNADLNARNNQKRFTTSPSSQVWTYKCVKA